MLFQNENAAAPYRWRNILTKPAGGDRWSTAGSEAIALAKSIAIDPANSDRLYIPYGDHAYFTSDDGGQTLEVLVTFETLKKQSGNRGDSGTLMVDERDPRLLYAATEGPHQQFDDGGVMISRDNGKTWETIGGQLDGDERGLPRAGIMDLAVEYEGDKRNLYVASYGSKSDSGGVYFLRATDAKNRWQRILAAAGTRALASRDNFDALFAGVDGKGVYQMERRDGEWRQTQLIELGSSKKFYDLETGPESGTIYAATDAGLFAIGRGGRAVKISPPLDASRKRLRSAVEVFPQNEDIIYFTTDRSAVFRSSDRGRTWQEISSGIPTMGFVVLKVDPSRDIIYAEPPGGGIWKRRFD